MRQEIISVLDLTLLDLNAKEQNIQTLADKSVKYKVAALCIYPRHLTLVKTYPIKKATVINFPSGEEGLSTVLNDLKLLMQTEIVDEIDYVFPYRTYLSGEQQLALAHYQATLELAKTQKKCFKVILETGEIANPDQIFEISSTVAKLGCNFLKTSTGKTPHGASIPAVTAMLTALKEGNYSCGIKVSGGVKTVDQAQEYINLAETLMGKKIHPSWFRIGASTLLDSLISIP